MDGSHLSEEYKFAYFDKKAELKEFSHRDNGVVWFTDGSYLFPYEFNNVVALSLNEMGLLFGAHINVRELLPYIDQLPRIIKDMNKAKRKVKK